VTVNWLDLTPGGMDPSPECCAAMSESRGRFRWKKGSIE